MKRKPDLLWVLVLIFTLGVVTTGYTQSFWEQRQSQQQYARYTSETPPVREPRPARWPYQPPSLTTAAMGTSQAASARRSTF